VRRFRLSTLMLVIVIAGLCFALLVQERRHAAREQQHAAREQQTRAITADLAALASQRVKQVRPQRTLSDAEISAREGLPPPVQSEQAPEP
jgi:hypothetical protein